MSLHAPQAEVSLREPALLRPRGSRGIELKLSDFAASAFTSRALLEPLPEHFKAHARLHVI